MKAFFYVMYRVLFTSDTFAGAKYRWTLHCMNNATKALQRKEGRDNPRGMRIDIDRMVRDFEKRGKP